MSICNLHPACTPGSFNFPAISGTSLLAIEATPVTNYSSSGWYQNNGPITLSGLEFCNVSLTYSHTNANDHVSVQVWLPSSDSWNERMVGGGGGGVGAGLFDQAYVVMAGAVNEGYVSIGTSAGVARDIYQWALKEDGDVNWDLLENLGSRSLGELAVIGKSVVRQFYGREPRYSYWNGCSQGGRQGYELAQRFPGAFDGIAASAPAINWNRDLVAGLWAPVFMNMNGYPYNCEVSAITSAAISACDPLDGVTDGVITDTSLCTFDPRSQIGKEVDCLADSRLPKVKITPSAAALIQAIWDGAKHPDNSSMFPGYTKETMTGGSFGTTGTTCTNGTCIPSGYPLSRDWIRLFLLRDPAANLWNATWEEWDKWFYESVQRYGKFIETNSTDLRAFGQCGGKLLTFHGGADQLITPKNSEAYYDEVTSVDPDIHDYYRLFLAPGVQHCNGGPGAFPYDTFKALVKWVEEGIAPETLPARSIPKGNETVFERKLCAYPKKQFYNGGDVNSADSFGCR
ncbi:hypothetical protein HYFRA_00012675 [Hymenoscyphus fraxineus]|uniref:Carboxylic ester hydrolase n=1 Tax=Hymenoscyphus fraxineus TaxID=746836 RepID=A0A9N9L8D4_9HELO|nr:hypothetical protein HYFRA_00012675 [Hymenoscyphus fraxineus]